MDTRFDPIDPTALNENYLSLIKNDWMLLTAGTVNSFNTMTANWGTIGYLWNKPVAICFIRPQRYTFEFAEKHDFFTLSFFGQQYREVLDFCGTHSGRDIDKATNTGLRAMETEKGNVAFEQARLVMECRKLYADFLKPGQFIVSGIESRNYPGKDYHKFYVAEITGCFRKK
jgi:flavin reductase (DIM6/NTAB) family NADH-FMN oxidoreductase RutF